MKTLAVCIPTYRRPELLRRCVVSAIESAAEVPFRIYIADDSATDVNVPVLSELCLRYPMITWVRNAQTLGIDGNIHNVVALADCDYAWLIGEDDRFLPGAISRMHAIVQTCVSPFIFANYEYVDEAHTHALGLALVDAQTGFHPVEPFIARSLWAVGFIGGCVMEKAAWKKACSSAYKGTYFRHVGHIVEVIATAPGIYVLAEPSVANRAAGEHTFTWKHDSFGVFLGFEAMCAIAARRHTDLKSALIESVKTYRERIAYFSVKTSFRLRSEGSFDWRQYRIHIVPATISPWLKAWLLLLVALPVVVLKPFAKIYRSVASRYSK